VRLQVSKQSGKNTVAIAEGLRAEIERINRDMRNVNLTVLDDQSKFIERSIGAVKEAVYIGAFLVIAIIFIFLRNIRSTVIICTSIPISIVGTFALLYFAGFTLNTMTFGGLALGVGMIVDASIVVLENTFRHMEHGKPRMQAAIEGSEEVWSAILASTLTHIAVFVPLLFLSGRLEHPVRAALDRRHVLARDVALRRGHGRSGALLAPAEAAAARRSAHGHRRPPVHGQREHARKAR
jgi:HAE1 family hydrophobic/amphiphilic exporter-1